MSETLAQFRARAIHDVDFEAFRLFPSPSISSILDVGANRGQSIASLRTVLPHSAIDAFEANPAFYEVLDALTASVPGPLRIHRFGLGRENARLAFYIPWVDDVPYLEEASTRTDYFEKPWVVEKFRARGSLRLEQHFVEVRAGDELGLRPDLIKVDVEGAEHDVLLGLCNTINHTRPFLLIENSDWHNVTPFLGDLGYAPYQWEAATRSLVPFYKATTNTFYLHATKREGLPLV
ncbi:MAG TPA: FkbM family methyltransferase [Casimicrobiaceae bacterium]|nr:FkbM family methyltransferase [Casimicrobiaceae bacterium]